MTDKARLQTKPATPKPTVSLSRPSILQRTCACGGVPGLTGKCEACSRQRLSRSPGATTPSTLSDRSSTDHAMAQSQQSPLPGFSFGKMAIAPKERFGGQAKLAIGQPGDQYEQEADLMDDQVMRMPAPECDRRSYSAIILFCRAMRSRVETKGAIVVGREKGDGFVAHLVDNAIAIQAIFAIVKSKRSAR